MDKYHWTYQCYRCFVKSGYGFAGTESEAYDKAPTCCGGELMHAIRGNTVRPTVDEIRGVRDGQ